MNSSLSLIFAQEGETTLQDAKDLCIKVLSKTLDMTKLTPDKIELAALQRVDGETVIKILDAEEVDGLIKKYEAAEKAAEEAKKEKERQQQLAQQQKAQAAAGASS